MRNRPYFYVRFRQVRKFFPFILQPNSIYFGIVRHQLSILSTTITFFQRNRDPPQMFLSLAMSYLLFFLYGLSRLLVLGPSHGRTGVHLLVDVETLPSPSFLGACLRGASSKIAVYKSLSRGLTIPPSLALSLSWFDSCVINIKVSPRRVCANPLDSSVSHQTKHPRRSSPTG